MPDVPEVAPTPDLSMDETPKLPGGHGLLFPVEEGVMPEGLCHD
jgi:hypothetical protein